MESVGKVKLFLAYILYVDEQKFILYTSMVYLERKEEKALLGANRLHNTRMIGKGIKIISWRLLIFK